MGVDTKGRDYKVDSPLLLCSRDKPGENGDPNGDLKASYHKKGA